MPEKGFKSITVKQEVYDWLMKEYKKSEKEWLIKYGISSFTGYVTFRLAQLIEKENSHSR